MKVGLLWFDNDPKRDLTEKITRAARCYRNKFGIPPDACYIHKSSALGGNGQTAKVGQIRVTTKPFILPHHLQIGQEDQP